ncbi:MAG: DUF4058 family protein [Gemmataceae bacterium]
MPIHDWTKVQSGLFHAFHQSWSVRIQDSLNGELPKGYYALVEQKVDGPEPDVIAVEMKKRSKPISPTQSSTVVMLEPPQTTFTAQVDQEAFRYARKANRISIRHPLGEVVAVIEIVSPGNKDSRIALRSFVNKAVAFLQNGIHLLIVDLFPPSVRDPQGIHRAIWDELADNSFELPTDKRLTLVSYDTSDGLTAHIEPVAVGTPLAAMPLFLERGLHVMVPLEATYQATWTLCPEPIRELVEAEE